ncbi:DUF1801 domain-containing protein [Niallia sp. FSL W8-0635]|uniref:DUF1801 domain-containing protein n=1 Tax=Niallia sp. FSL W8-0635 TaxID=2975337 RepID=UPI0009C532C7|nr:Domain of uncharacterised function (DU1801) [Mycobacteroides abscessus subsp. abscessus]HEO8419103.1 DUF1801 domain-containing protein [Yersinia enterocolitica]
MYQLKTKETDQDVVEFIETSLPSTAKKEDAYKLIDLFSEVTSLAPKMWGTSIIGFGSYHYRYDSGHEGDAPIVGFSPRKARISLYLTTEEETRTFYLEQIGKHKTGVGCVYINKLADIKEEILREFIEKSVELIHEKYQVFD